MTVHDLTPDQVADWRACSASIVEDYISNNTDLARQLMAAYGKLRTDPCCTARPGNGRQLQPALRRARGPAGRRAD